MFASSVYVSIMYRQDYICYAWGHDCSAEGSQPFDNMGTKRRLRIYLLISDFKLLYGCFQIDFYAVQILFIYFLLFILKTCTLTLTMNPLQHGFNGENYKPIFKLRILLFYLYFPNMGCPKTTNLTLERPTFNLISNKLDQGKSFISFLMCLISLLLFK